MTYRWLAPVLLIASACSQPPTTFAAGGGYVRVGRGVQSPSTEPLLVDGPVTVVGGRIDGQLNGLGLNSVASEHSFFADEFGVSGMLLGHGEGVGLGMALLTIDGGLSLMEPMVVYENTLAELVEPLDPVEPNAPVATSLIPRVMVVECTNPTAVSAADGWATDERAQQASITSVDGAPLLPLAVATSPCPAPVASPFMADRISWWPVATRVVGCSLKTRTMSAT
jgi:hypothetical protein